MCQFSRIATISLNVSFLLHIFPNRKGVCTLCRGQREMSWNEEYSGKICHLLILSSQTAKIYIDNFSMKIFKCLPLERLRPHDVMVAPLKPLRTILS